MKFARQRRIRRILAKRQAGLTVVLENIYDPYNVEAVLRSCDAFGIQDVHVIQNTRRKPLKGRIRNTTSGSAKKWLTVHHHQDIAACIQNLKASGFTVVATVTESHASESLFNTNFEVGQFALLMGNEHDGLSDSAVSLADRWITLPMRGLVQSLNISVTAALFLYEVTKQRLVSNTMRPIGEQQQRNLFRQIMAQDKNSE